jgi:hypothetical protein
VGPRTTISTRALRKEQRDGRSLGEGEAIVETLEEAEDRSGERRALLLLRQEDIDGVAVPDGGALPAGDASVVAIDASVENHFELTRPEPRVFHR